MGRVVLAAALMTLMTTCDVGAGEDEAGAKRDAIVVRALQRMEGYDYRQDQDVVAAVTRHLNRKRGTPEFLNLAKEFNPPGIEDELVKLVTKAKDASVAVEAAGMLLSRDEGRRQAEAILSGEDMDKKRRVIQMLGLLGNRQAVELLTTTLKDPVDEYDRRSAAVRALAKSNLGQKRLLQLAEADELPADTRLLAGGLLAASDDESIKSQAAEALPLPQQADQKPLPPLDQLAKRRGSVDAGQKLFRGTATCANCHVVDKHGKQVGPDLSEIGSKLSREAMYTSILDPSAGISHNYENYVALLNSGQVITGVMVSETDDKVILRTAEAIDRELDRDEIEAIRKSEKSIMPENLHHSFSEQGLVDLVEYMMTLKKKP